MSTTKNKALNWYSSMKKRLRKIFDIENWLWKSEIGIFRSLDDDYPSSPWIIWHFFFQSAIFHSMKLPFDAEVDEKFLNGIYCTYSTYLLQNLYLSYIYISWKLDFFFLGSFGFDGPNFSFPDLDMEGKIKSVSKKRWHIWYVLH